MLFTIQFGTYSILQCNRAQCRTTHYDAQHGHIHWHGQTRNLGTGGIDNQRCRRQISSQQNWCGTVDGGICHTLEFRLSIEHIACLYRRGHNHRLLDFMLSKNECKLCSDNSLRCMPVLHDFPSLEPNPATYGGILAGPSLISSISDGVAVEIKVAFVIDYRVQK